MQSLLPLILVAVFFTPAWADPEEPTPCAYYLSKVNRKNKSVITKIENLLKETSIDATTLYAAKSEHLGTFSWVVALKKKDCAKVYDTLKDNLSGWDNLSQEDSLKPQRAGLVRRAKPDNPLVKNPIAQPKSETFDEVQQLSQPEGVTMKGMPPYYYYDGSAGEGTVLYCIDSGAQMTIPELENVNVEKWLWAGPSPATNEKTDGDKETWHGTGVLSKAVGKTLGVARKANVVVVRYTDFYGQKSNAHGIDAFLQTYDDIKKRHSSSKVVVEFSSNFVGNKKWIKDITTEIMEAFVAMKNALVVMSAGNGGPSTPITTYPQVLGATIPELVVVGGTTLRGDNKFQTAPFVKISAVADILAVSSGVKDPDIDEYIAIASGTSFSAPFVAGLANYFMGLGDTATTVQKRLYENAWPRKAGGPPVAFNGLDYRNHPTLPTTAAIHQRGLGGAMEPQSEFTKERGPVSTESKGKATGKTGLASVASRKRPTEVLGPEVAVPVTRMRGTGGRCVGRCKNVK